MKHLPLFKNAIKDPRQYAIYQGWATQMDFQRPLSVPPGTPKERVEILRRGFAATLKDPELLAEANKSKLVITSVSDERTEKLVNEILSLPADVKENLSFLVRHKGT